MSAPHQTYAFVAALPVGQEPPEWVKVAMVGVWEGYSKGPIELTAQDLVDCVRNFSPKGRVVIDWEHQSLNTIKNGQPAPAAGWVTALELRGDGTELWARCDWGSKAAEQIRSREYAFVSPVIFFHFLDPRTGRDIGAFFDSLALTNRPFLEELPALAAGRTEHSMNSLLALLALTLGVSAEENAVVARATDLVNDSKQARKALGLPENADRAAIEKAWAEVDRLRAVGEVVASHLKAQPTESAEALVARARAELGHAGYVPASEVTTLRQELVQLKADQLVARAQGQGKIVAAQTDWLRNWAKGDLIAATAWVDVAAVVFPGPAKDRTAPGLVASALSPEEERQRVSLGVTVEQWNKAKEDR